MKPHSHYTLSPLASSWLIFNFKTSNEGGWKKKCNKILKSIMGINNNTQLLFYLDTSTHFLWMTFSSRLMKRRWAGIESYFPLHRVRKWCFRHLWVQSGIPICLLEIGNGGMTRHSANREPVAHRQRGSGRGAVCDCVHHWSSQCSTGPPCVSMKVLPVKHRCSAMMCFQVSLIMAYCTDLWHIYCNMCII